MNPTMKKTLIASSVALTLGMAANAAQASLVQNVFGANTWSTDRANFTMLTSSGTIVGGTNDVNMHWDGNAYSASSDYTGPGSAANVTASSTTPFNAAVWTAHDIQVFTAGSYTFNTTLDGGPNSSTPGFANALGGSGTMSATVPTGDLGMHMLFDWNGTRNIDVFVVAAGNSMFGAGKVYSTNATAFGSNNCTTTVKNCLWDGPGWVGGNAANRPLPSQLWMMASIDGNADGVMGIPMQDGPFTGFNANFNATMTATPAAVPVPAAVWLFGSGLLGLVGVARRKKA